MATSKKTAELERIKKSVAAQKRWRKSRVLNRSNRGAKVRTLDLDEKQRRALTAKANAAIRELRKDPKFREEMRKKISEGMRRRIREEKERVKKNPFGKLDKGKDFVPIAIAYAREAVEDVDGERYGYWIRRAARRFLDDLERAKQADAPFTFDAKEANKACRFIELLPHVEGKWETPNIVLVPAQIFFIVNLFGFRNSKGFRRFTTALFAVARKNAKSTLAAAIMLYVMCEEEDPGAQLYAAATTGDQARVVWRIAKAMLEKCHDLQRYYGVEPYANTIKRHKNGAFFKPINAKASTQDGLNPQAFTLDELHAHKTHDLMNVLTDAAGARDCPLFLYTTTEGFETPGPWPEVRQFAKNVLLGAVEADHFLVVYYALDEEDKTLGTKEDDDFDETKWRKANPLYDYNEKLRDTMRKLAIDAKHIPGKLGEFRIKRLNRPSSSAKTWIDMLKWNQCAGEVDLEWLRGHPCWGAFDLASTTDMVAWALVWCVDGVWYVHMRYWVPREAVRQRTERRTTPYQAWVESGYVTQTEGDRVDYDVIEKQIMADVEMFRPVKIAYDPWNAQQFSTRLANQGVDLEVFIQGPRSYHPAMQALEIAYGTGNLRHGGNPVLRWNAANLVPRYDVNLNMAPDRKRSADKIDGMCALLMAMGLAIVDTGDDSAGFFNEPVTA